jgi:hypothetical protein
MLSGKSLKWEPRYSREDLFPFKQSALLYWPKANKLTTFVENVRDVIDLSFPVNSCKGAELLQRRNTAT